MRLAGGAVVALGAISTLGTLAAPLLPDEKTTRIPRFKGSQRSKVDPGSPHAASSGTPTLSPPIGAFVADDYRSMLTSTHQSAGEVEDKVLDALFKPITKLEGPGGSDFSFLQRPTVDVFNRLDERGRQSAKRRTQTRWEVGSSTVMSCPGPAGPIPLAPKRSYPLPANHPKPLVGEFSAMGADGETCTTYEDRFGAYTDEALRVGYREDALLVAESELLGPKKPAAMTTPQWEAEIRAHMVRANERAEELGPGSFPDWRALMDGCHQRRRGTFPHKANVADRVDADFMQSSRFKTLSSSSGYSKATREGTAVVVRSYEGFVWRYDDILNLRALIAEVNLNSPEPWDVRLLVEVRSQGWALSMSVSERLDFLTENVPREFWGLVEFWSVPEMISAYPAMPGNIMGDLPLQCSYRSCLMPVQKFHHDHTYSYVWNIEHDVRFLGNWRDLFDGTADWAKRQPIQVSLDRFKNWKIPGLERSRQEWAEDEGEGTMRGEEADLVTLNPIFDPVGSQWFWWQDVQNYPDGLATPRRASVGTNMRLSANLLEAMSRANADNKQSTHCESWPETILYHSGLYPAVNLTFGEYTRDWDVRLPMKGAFAPIPVYFEHDWQLDSLYAHLNRRDFYHPLFERAMMDSSFYYHARHAKRIYDAWRREPDSVCRAPALLHPIKAVDW